MTEIPKEPQELRRELFLKTLAMAPVPRDLRLDLDCPGTFMTMARTLSYTARRFKELAELAGSLEERELANAEAARFTRMLLDLRQSPVAIWIDFRSLLES